MIKRKITFGNYDTAAQGWTLTGLGDEVRVYNGAASDLWVKTEYDTVSNPTFSRVTVDTGWTGATGFSVHIL